MFSFNVGRMDWVLNGAIFVLAAFSLITIYSVAPNLFWYQALWFLLGAAAIIFFSQINWRSLVNYRWVVFGIYGFSVLLLIITYFFAPTIRNARSWLVVGPIQIQTAEFAKIALIIIFAYFFAHRHVSIAQWHNIAVPFIYFLVPTTLVLLQPDLGSALVLFGLWVSFLLVSGIRWRHLVWGILIISMVAMLGWHSFLQNYQKERIVAVFNPDYDALGINYSVSQSKIAIGSAGFWGKGFKQGTQAQLGFLPEAPTDFIFSAFMEEWGLFGAIIFLITFLTVMTRVIKLGLRAENNFDKLICLGIISLFFIHFTVNMGSAIGLLPVIGISLPFFSYGGSNLLMDAMLIGMAQSISVRFKY